MKLLITVQDDQVAPRFDLTTEVVIAEYDRSRLRSEPRYLILPRKSAEDLCDLVVKEGITCVICGGIEDNLHKFFQWKKIEVLDNIIGAHVLAMQRAIAGQLEAGTILPMSK